MTAPPLADATRSPAGATPSRAGAIAALARKRGPAGGGDWLERSLEWWPVPALAGVLCFVAFLAGGGLNLGHMTTVEISLTLASGVIVALVALLAPARERAYGSWAVGLLFAFAALTALSVVWSVQPDDSFKDAGRMFAYCGVFTVAVALARAAPRRWPVLLAAIVLSASVICGYALLTKVFPNQFDANDIYARLRAPYSYWNAIGLTAALGAMSCMWLGARRAGHALLSSLSYPAMGLMLLTLLLAYSRGALVALVLGLALWFCIVPLRLRGAVLLISSSVVAGGVVAWAFKKHALSTDNVPLAARTAAGHQLGALILVMLVLLLIVGLAFGFWTSRQAPSIISRRRAGALLLALLLVVVLAGVGGLAASHRGLTGSVSHALHSLTDPHAKVPPNTPGRLTAVGSVRARYWNEALKVFKDHPALGVGAEGYATARLRYRTETLDVRHAHGYIVQTLADLGLVGLTLTLVLLIAWMVAARRSTHPLNERLPKLSSAMPPWLARLLPGEPDPDYPAPDPESRRTQRDRHPPLYTPERIGMLCMLCLVVVFGIHSLADWTWYVPGNAVVALLCAGWLAGRGPLAAGATSLVNGHPVPAGVAVGTGASAGSGGGPSFAAGRGAGVAAANGESAGVSGNGAPRRQLLAQALRERLRPRELGALRIGVAVAAIVGALLAAWAQWQPQRSANTSQQALALLASDPRAALSEAKAAVSQDPLSAQALFTLSTVQQASGEARRARETLARAVRKQPSNPQTWLTLGEYDLAHGNPRAAVDEIGAAIYLNPESVAPEAIASGNPEAIAIQNDYAQAYRAAATQHKTQPNTAARPRTQRPNATHTPAPSRPQLGGATLRGSTGALGATPALLRARAFARARARAQAREKALRKARRLAQQQAAKAKP